MAGSQAYIIPVGVRIIPSFLYLLVFALKPYSSQDFRVIIIFLVSFDLTSFSLIPPELGLQEEVKFPWFLTYWGLVLRDSEDPEDIGEIDRSGESRSLKLPEDRKQEADDLGF